MSTASSPYAAHSDRGYPGVAPVPGAVAALESVDFPPGNTSEPGRAVEPGGLESERNRLNLAFEAIQGLAGCVDQLVRELRRGAGGAQLRVVQEEVMRLRRLVTTRPEVKEGPPRDEGPASQPPPPYLQGVGASPREAARPPGMTAGA